MNEKNLAYLKDNIKYLGFGEKLFADLENNIRQGKPDFTLNINTIFNRDAIGATLHFRKSENMELYFFNKYDVRLEKSNDESKGQTFYLDNGKGITLKEAYNLLEGRAVFKELSNKDGEKYQAWVQLDFKEKDKHENFKMRQFHENYGYDIKAHVENIILSNFAPEVEQQLMKSLQKGNIQSVVVMDKNTNELKVFIEANPQYKTLNMYDNNMKMLSKEEKAEILIKPGLQQKENKAGGLSKDKIEFISELGSVVKDVSKEIKNERSDTQSNDNGLKNNASKIEKRQTVEGNSKKKDSSKSVKELLPQNDKPSKRKGLKI